MTVKLFSGPQDWLQGLYSNTLLAPILCQLVKALPLTWLLLWIGFRTIPQDSLDTARIAGASSWRQLWGIAIPLRFTAIVCTWLCGVILGLGELSASILVVPPGVTTLSIRIFGLVHYGVEDQLAALCLATTIFVLGLATVVLVAIRSAKRVGF